MKTNNASILCLLILPTAISLSGCDQAQRTSAWYDYGNGLINLENVTYISSSADLVISAKPSMEHPVDQTSEKAAIYAARENFCNSRIKPTRVKKSLGEILQDADLLESAKSGVDSSVLDACQITVIGDARIVFDSFTLELASISVNVNKLVESNTTQDSIQKLQSLNLEPFAGDWVQRYETIKEIIGSSRNRR